MAQWTLPDSSRNRKSTLDSFTVSVFWRYMAELYAPPASFQYYMGRYRLPLPDEKPA